MIYCARIMGITPPTYCQHKEKYMYIPNSNCGHYDMYQEFISPAKLRGAYELLHVYFGCTTIVYTVCTKWYQSLNEHY